MRKTTEATCITLSRARGVTAAIHNQAAKPKANAAPKHTSFFRSDRTSRHNSGGSLNADSLAEERFFLVLLRFLFDSRTAVEGKDGIVLRQRFASILRDVVDFSQPRPCFRPVRVVCRPFKN